MGRGGQIIDSLNTVLTRKEKVKREPVLTETVFKTTRKGVECRLDIYNDIDDNAVEPYKIDLLEVHVNSQPAGYLKICYLPSQVFKEHFPSPLHYAIKDRNALYKLDDLIDQPEWSKEDYKYALQQAYNTWDFQSYKQNLDNKSSSELVKLWKEIADKLEYKYKEEYTRRQQLTDRPLIDFIRVYEGDEWNIWRNGKQEDLKEYTGKDFRRQGIAEQLYKTGAEWMAKKGFRLHASGIQSSAAASVWNKMAEEGWVENDGEDRYLNPDAWR